MNLINLLENNYWLAAIVVSVIYISDYAMTYKSAKLYKKGANKHFDIEGGIELNPQFRKDVEKLKKINPKFIFLLLTLNLILFYMFWLSKIDNNKNMIEFFLGAWILTEAFIHTRHSKSFYLYKAAVKADGLSGQIKYSRPLAHKLAAIDALTFAAFYFVLWLLLGRIFFIGGALSCLFSALVQRKWLKKNMSEMSR